jgi:hypothetical protein
LLTFRESIVRCAYYGIVGSIPSYGAVDDNIPDHIRLALYSHFGGPLLAVEGVVQAVNNYVLRVCARSDNRQKRGQEQTKKFFRFHNFCNWLKSATFAPSARFEIGCKGRAYFPNYHIYELYGPLLADLLKRTKLDIYFYL